MVKYWRTFFYKLYLDGKTKTFAGIWRVKIWRIATEFAKFANIFPSKYFPCTVIPTATLPQQKSAAAPLLPQQLAASTLPPVPA